jgi:hypothetical protein
MVKDTGGIKASLISFDPTTKTKALVEALTAFRSAEQDLKKEHAKKFMLFKNPKEGKVSDGTANEMIEDDKEYQSIEAKLIVAEGKYISAKLSREDYYEVNNDTKKLADIEMLEMSKFEPKGEKPAF